jgi:pimeloyl-ACP methyl ester carboxylesterase
VLAPSSEGYVEPDCATVFAVDRPRLLLVPSFTELEWGIRPQLEEWAEVATFDMPGVGGEPLPDDLGPDPKRAAELLARWREAGTERALGEPERRGWDRFFVVADSRGVATAVELAARRREAVQGLAIGHASLSKSTEGDRAPERAGIWDAVAQLAKQGNEAFVRYGIAQATRGGFDEETAQQMIERFPDMDLVSAMVEALGREPEPIGNDLAALDRPLLLGKHEGCLGSTDEGFEDIVAAFPRADTVICPEACSSSPAFADAIRRFCGEVGPS